jgi:hypothetical protein
MPSESTPEYQAYAAILALFRIHYSALSYFSQGGPNFLSLWSRLDGSAAVWALSKDLFMDVVHGLTSKTGSSAVDLSKMESTAAFTLSSLTSTTALISSPGR